MIGAFVVGALISAAYGLVVPTDPGGDRAPRGRVGNANETAAALVAGGALAAALAAALQRPAAAAPGRAIVVPAVRATPSS